MKKAFSQACENNKQPILDILSQEFSQVQSVLEIGSGTGQHAVHFAQHLPHLTWSTSDLTINHQSIELRITEASLPNLNKPITLDLNQPWAIKNVDAIFTANTLHIVSYPLVIKFFEGVDKHLTHGGKLCIYGPFNYNGQFTSQSNSDFDLWLKARDPQSGIRHIEDIVKLANQANLVLTNDHQMPANNRLLTFIKR